MATVREMAQRLAAQGVTKERFVEIMSSFGVDPLDPASQDVEVGEQFASAPLMPGEGPQRGAPLTFEQPAVFGFQPEPATGMRPPPQRPLPYATDVQRPFEAPLGQAALRNQPVERLPSALTEAIRQRPDQALIRTKQAYPVLQEGGGSGVVRAPLEMAQYALRPDETPELQAELDLERGLDVYQKAALSGAGDRLAGRAAAMATRLGVFAGESAQWIGNKALEGVSVLAPEQWSSDEPMQIGRGIVLSAERRRELDRLFEQQDADTVKTTDDVLKDAVKRIEGAPFLERAYENSFEFVESTIDMLNWMSGGNIPKEYWQIASGPEAKGVLEGINEVLVDEAQEVLPQMGNDMVAFTKALFKEPENVASAYPVATAFTLYPLARRGYIKMSPAAASVASKVYNAAQKVPELTFPKKGGFVDRLASEFDKNIPEVRVSVGALVDQVVRLSNAFQRWKVDPAKMADPAMNKLANELLVEAPQAEAAVRAAGAQLSEALGPRLDPPPRPRAGRPAYEEGAPFDGPAARPASEGFTFRDVPEPQPMVEPVAPVEPLRLGPAVEGAETFALRPSQRQARPTVAAELVDIMQSDPVMADLVAALVRRGVSAEEIVGLVNRSRQPSSTRPTSMEVTRRPLDPADAPSFDPVDLPEGFTRGDLGLPRREFAARGEGGLRVTDPPEVLPEVANIRAQIEARRNPPPVDTTPVQPGFEMALRQSDQAPVGSGVEVVPPRPTPPPFTPPTEPVRVGRKPYERPAIEPGLEPPRAARGFEFSQRQFDLGADGKTRPVAGSVDTLVKKDPKVKDVNARAFQIIEDMAEAIGDRVPDARRLMYEEFQAARAENIANNLQIEALRGDATRKLAAFLEKETRQPVDKRSLRAQLEKAADDPSTVYDLNIGYNHWQSGARKNVSVVDFMERRLGVNETLRQNVSKDMTIANFSRAGTRFRKLSHQSTAEKTLAKLHPDEGIRTSMDGKSAAKSLPTPGEEVGFLVGELLDNGTLPPLIRNPPELLLDAAPEMPQLLRRRLENMKEVPPEIARDVLGFDVGKGTASGRDVRIPLNELAPVGPSGPKTPAQGKLWMSADLLQSLRYISKDRKWLGQAAQSPTGANAFFEGLARIVKKGGVALNPSSHAAAWLSNSAAAALKYANPLAFLEAIKWGIDYARWSKDIPQLKSKAANALYSAEEVMRAITRGDILDSSFVLTELPSKALAPRAVDSFLTKAKKGLSKGLEFDALARLFDMPDNVFKGWATMKGVNKYVSEWQTLPEGKSFTLPMSRGVEKRAYKRATNKPNMSDMVIDGKQLTRAQMLQEMTRSSAFEAAQTFVNFNRMPLIQVAGRSTPAWDAMAKSPWSGWTAATTMVPGRQGIVGEILSGPARRSTTDYLPLMLKRNAEAVAHGLTINSVVGSQAAQSDETSSLFRLAKAFSPDEVKPVIVKPTGEEGAYSVWPLGNSSPIEDLGNTIRWMEGARSMLSKGLEYVDPTELSYLTEEKRKEMFNIKPEDVKKLPPRERARLKAAQGLANPTTKGYGFSEKALMDSVLLGSSVIGELLVALTDGRGYKVGGRNLRMGAGEWDGVAKAVKFSQRGFLPRVFGKSISAQAEALINERKELLNNIDMDNSLGGEERASLFREIQSDIDYLEFIAGAQYRPPAPKTEVSRRAEMQLTDLMLDHFFNLPRLEMFLGEGSVTEKFLKKKLKRTVKEMVRSITKREIDKAELRLKEAKRSGNQRMIDSARMTLRSLKVEYKEFDKRLNNEIDARIDMVKEQDKAAQQTVKDYSKTFDKKGQPSKEP